MEILCFLLIVLFNAYSIPRNIKTYRERNSWHPLAAIGLGVLSLILGVILLAN